MAGTFRSCSGEDSRDCPLSLVRLSVSTPAFQPCRTIEVCIMNECMNAMNECMNAMNACIFFWVRVHLEEGCTGDGQEDGRGSREPEIGAGAD